MQAFRWKQAHFFNASVKENEGEKKKKKKKKRFIARKKKKKKKKKTNIQTIKSRKHNCDNTCWVT